MDLKELQVLRIQPVNDWLTQAEGFHGFNRDCSAALPREENQRLHLDKHRQLAANPCFLWKRRTETSLRGGSDPAGTLRSSESKSRVRL